MKVHFTDPYLLNPQHRITVNLVGIGGTGSQVLTCLARLNQALIGLNHPGIYVKCFDNDEVTSANIGRQLFSPAEVGMNKAVAMVSRVNRFFGFEWEAHPEKYKGQKANIIITCIDSAAGRVKIGEQLATKSEKSTPYDRKIYWLDFGNLKKTGQVVLGTLQPIKQPNSKFQTVSSLPTVTKKFKNLSRINEKDQGPSCSIAQALNRQDLFINSTLAQLGSNILWNLFKEGMISNHGCYLNLESMNVNPIKIS